MSKKQSTGLDVMNGLVVFAGLLWVAMACLGAVAISMGVSGAGI
jgi:hypothetical protein